MRRAGGVGVNAAGGVTGVSNAVDGVGRDVVVDRVGIFRSHAVMWHKATGERLFACSDSGKAVCVVLPLTF